MRASALAALLLVLPGCGGDTGDPAPRATPTIGGPSPTAQVPTDALDDLERPIAAELAGQVAAQGLHVDHLDCPAWDQQVPAQLTCRGWFDGVEGTVTVTLTRGKRGAVTFDAVLNDGVIATKKLVDELTGKGYDDVDCGDAPAYATDVGSSIVCSVERQGEQKFVTVTITDERGGVTISDF